MFSTKEFANKIREIAQERNVSVIKVLNDCGINRNFMYDLERVQALPSIERVVTLADYFGVSVDYFIGRTSYEKVVKDEDASILYELENLSLNEKKEIRAIASMYSADNRVIDFRLSAESGNEYFSDEDNEEEYDDDIQELEKLHDEQEKQENNIEQNEIE